MLRITGKTTLACRAINSFNGKPQATAFQDFPQFHDADAFG